MRLPADAVLLIIDVEDALDGPRDGDAPNAERNIAALVAGWRAEGLPLAHVGRPAFRAAVPPLDGEIVIVQNAGSAFVGSDLEARLDELGATTLVLCGTLANHALEASARHAADLGYQVFIVADACRAADAVDLRGPLSDDMRARALAHLKGEIATIVDVETALGAAATAKARQRRGQRQPDGKATRGLPERQRTSLRRRTISGS